MKVDPGVTLLDFLQHDPGASCTWRGPRQSRQLTTICRILAAHPEWIVTLVMVSAESGEADQFGPGIIDKIEIDKDMPLCHKLIVRVGNTNKTLYWGGRPDMMPNADVVINSYD
jgi:hypothetical protein